MKERLIEIIKEKSLEFGDFTLKSGIKANFYLDIKKLALSGLLHIVVSQMREAVNGLIFDAIGGPSIGADPLVGGYLALYGEESLNGFLIRPSQKDHGKSQRVIGSVQPGDRCVVIEDVTTSGGSLLDACEEIVKYGGSVVLALTIVDRLQGAQELFKEKNIPFKSLVTIDEIL